MVTYPTDFNCVMPEDLLAALARHSHHKELSSQGDCETCYSVSSTATATERVHTGEMPKKVTITVRPSEGASVRLKVKTSRCFDAELDGSCVCVGVIPY